MECVCVEEYQDIKIGMKFDVLEIWPDYYLLDSNKGWRIEVSIRYFDKCFKCINID